MVGERKKRCYSLTRQKLTNEKAEMKHCYSISEYFYFFFFFFCIGWRRFLFFWAFISIYSIVLRSKWVEPAFPPKLDGLHGLGLIRNIRVVCCVWLFFSELHPSTVYKRRVCAFESCFLFPYWKIDIAMIKIMSLGLEGRCVLAIESKLVSHLSF